MEGCGCVSYLRGSLLPLEEDLEVWEKVRGVRSDALMMETSGSRVVGSPFSRRFHLHSCSITSYEHWCLKIAIPCTTTRKCRVEPSLSPRTVSSRIG